MLTGRQQLDGRLLDRVDTQTGYTMDTHFYSLHPCHAMRGKLFVGDLSYGLTNDW